MGQTSQLFLNTLWQTQNIQKGSGELEELLEGIDNSITALRFVQKSLDAAKQTQSLQEDELRDSNFLSEFITFAVEYSDAPFGDEWNSNLDSFWFGVWNSESSGSLIGAATDLQNLIESANPDVSESLGEWLLGNSSNAEILYASTSGQQDPCLDLLGTIRALVAKLIERSDELIADPYDLQFDNWSKANPKVVRLPDGRERNLGSIEGHQEQFRNRQKQLRDLLKKWDEDECRNKTGIKISKSDRDWAFKAAPKPKPKPKPSENQGFQMPDWAVALGVIVVGGAIVIGAALTLPVWAVAALTFLAATTGLQLIDQRS
jgi:hypothetical protein